jgi:hypothetical protein
MNTEELISEAKDNRTKMNALIKKMQPYYDEYQQLLADQEEVRMRFDTVLTDAQREFDASR